MKIVFCGTIVPESYDTKLKYLSPAGNRFQINFCRELIKQGNDLKILSYIGFPVGKCEFDSEKEFMEGRVEYIYKRESLMGSVYLFLKKMKKEMENADVVITYNVTYAWGIAPLWTKKKVKSALILADFTEPSSYNNYRMKLYAKLQLYCIRRYDAVMGLSANTKKILKNAQSFVCIEGGISNYVYQYFEKRGEGSDKTVLMFSGLLEPVTGIDLLLEAFHRIGYADVELRISGKGSLTELVQMYTNIDPRIMDMGYLEYGQYLSKLSEAHILINPRNMHLQENDNNFPSKIMEYLATGKSIVSTKFPGYERFQEHIFFCESNIDDLQHAMEKTISDRMYDDEKSYIKKREFAKKFLWDRQIQTFLRSLA